MNHFKKALKYLLSYIFIISLLFNYVIAEDDETEEEKVYFEEKSVEQIASGLFYEKTTRFTEKGFVDIHVLKVDLEDETLDLDILRSIENFGNKEKVTALVENTKNAVAGINASFFNTKLNPTNIVGTEYENQYITTQNNYNVNYIGPASLIKTTDNILFDYVESYIEVTNAHDIPLDVAAYNKLGNYTRPVIFDRTVIEHTNELEELNGLFKIAIEFGYVVNYKTPGEDIEVPNGGYIIVFPEIYNDIIVNSFDIGESVSVKIGTNLEEKMLEMVLSGGGKIIEKGKVVTSDFSVSPQSRHPRSAIGITEDQKYLIAMVVDGRGQSIGATHEELGQYLLAYGVYEGIHLDGGGSSTLVARNFGEDSIGIKNRPSDGVERKVANGLGFISNTTVGDIRKMKVEVDSNRVFINMPIAVSVSGVDENYNPVEIVPDLVTYSAKGIEGYFEDNIFYPLEAGKGSIICEYKDVKTTVSITAVDSYIDLDIQNKILFVDYLEEAQFLVNATDKDGFKSAVNPSNITYQLMNKEIGRFEEGVFIASEVAGMSKVILSV